MMAAKYLKNLMNQMKIDHFLIRMFSKNKLKNSGIGKIFQRLYVKVKFSHKVWETEVLIVEHVGKRYQITYAVVTTRQGERNRSHKYHLVIKINLERLYLKLLFTMYVWSKRKDVCKGIKVWWSAVRSIEGDLTVRVLCGKF